MQNGIVGEEKAFSSRTDQEEEKKRTRAQPEKEEVREHVVFVHRADLCNRWACFLVAGESYLWRNTASCRNRENGVMVFSGPPIYREKPIGAFCPRIY